MKPIQASNIVNIVIVTYNSEKVIGACLVSLLSQSKAEGYKVYVIDNNSSDTTRFLLSKWSDKASMIVNDRNIGFTKACNQGLKASKDKYILLLNPDTEINGQAINKLRDFMEENPKVAAVGPKLVYPDGRLQYSCRTFPSPLTFISRALNIGDNSITIRKHLMADFDHKTTNNVDWILGSCLLLRREAIENIGLLDERYPMYYSDIEFCWRAKQNGWQVAYFPSVEAKHHYQRQSSKKPLLNPLTWSHLKSAIRFFGVKYFRF